MTKPSQQPTIQLLHKVNQLGAYVQQTTSDKQVFETFWIHIDELCKRLRRYEGLPESEDK